MVTIIPAQPPGKFLQVAWHCAWCKHELPPLPRIQHQASTKKHIQHCPHAPRKATVFTNLKSKAKAQGINIKNKDRYQIWKAMTHKRFQRQQQDLFQQLRDRDHRPVYLGIDKKDEHTFTCTACACIWRTTKQGEKAQQCQTAQRETFLNSQSRKRMWQTLTASQRTRLVTTWKLTKEEQAELRAKHAQSKYTIHTEWQRNLVEEGIEPNPGPSSTRQTTFLSLNTQGAENAFRFLQNGGHTADIVALQEVNFTAHQAAQAMQLAQKTHYRCWITRGNDAVDATGRPYVHGGIMTLIHTRHRSTRIINQHQEDSQFEASNMNDMIVVNYYKGQTTNIETFIDDVHHNIDPNQGQPMLCIGDFNTHVANFSAENQGQTFYVNNDKGEPIPSRWQGTRCIDFALAYNTKCEQLTYDPHVYSDHLQQSHGQDVSILVPTIHYGRPKQATPEQLTDTLFDIFKDFKSPEISTTEQEWIEFHTSLETHMAAAFQQYAEIRPTPQKRKKGSPPRIIPQRLMPKIQASNSTYCLRRLQKLLGRIRELNRQLKQGNQCNVLENNILKSWPHDVPATQTWQQQETQVQALLEAEVAKTHQNAISTWRRDMNAQGRKATRWLHNNVHCPVNTQPNMANLTIQISV